MSKTVFPPPPPTRNDLTVHQRSQLLRSTRKLGKILGTTPRLVDTNDHEPIMLDLPLSPGAFDGNRRFMHSTDSLSFPSSPTSTESSRSPVSARSFFPSSGYNSSSSSLDHEPYQLEELWPSLKQPPLHVSKNGSLQRSSSTASSVSSTRSRHNRSPSLDGFSSDNTHMTQYYTYSAQSASQARDSVLFSPSFSVPTDAASRRQKVDRLRRTLGDGVPVHLIFPAEEPSALAALRADTPALVPAKAERRQTFNIPRVPVPPLEQEEQPVISARQRKVLSIITE